MPGTLILKFHPGYQPSKTNAALTRAVANLPGVETVDLYALYPHEDDLKAAQDAEVERLYHCDRLCVQFPVHWFGAPPRAMAWQDIVLNRMFFLRPDEGKRLAGLPFMIAATAGMPRSDYAPGARNLYPLEHLLRPWEVTARQSGFAWHPAFLVYGTDDFGEAERGQAGAEFRARIEAWTSQRSGG